MIRSYKESDRISVIALWEEFDDHHVAMSDYYFRKPEKNELIARHNRYANQNGMLYMVSEEKGGIEGFICGQYRKTPSVSLLKERTILELHGICVGQKYRHRGLAGQLIGAVVDLAKREQIKDIEVMIWDFNDPIQNIIRSAGFRLISGKYGLTLNE